MSSDSEAQAAITALNGTELGGRTLTVNEARPRSHVLVAVEAVAAAAVVVEAIGTKL